jgi:hypothetical protein
MNSEQHNNDPSADRLDDLTDDDLLELLGGALRTLPTEIDPHEEPPASVLDGGRWVHDWINMDAQLARLTFDSTEHRELAGVRSAASPLRELTFVTDEHTIELEITPGSRTTAISGTVEPPTPGQVRLVIGGEPFTGELDSAGNFEIRDLPTGTVLALVEVGDGKIRLGSFEI